MKWLFMLLFIIHSFYAEKGYLKFAHTHGISRMQLQHPVKGCNPLTQKEGGCETDFAKLKDLPYCTQSGPPQPYLKSSKNIKQEKCVFLDEFDIQLPGYQQGELMIPTRRTKYVQHVKCGEEEADRPCPLNDELKRMETIYMADIEDFTLLIDHSFVSDELHTEMRAWDMLGFVNPCGRGAELGGDKFNLGERTKRVMHKMLPGEGKEKKNNHCKNPMFMPIHRPEKMLDKAEDATAEKLKRDKGFAMWMSSKLQTFLPFFFEPEPHKQAHQNPAPFQKVPNGDIMKVKDILALAGTDLDDPDELGRLEGMVIIINIHYTNWKEYSWPNKADPAYFYSFSVAPADEFKLMHEAARHQLASRDESGDREIFDFHGIFIIVKQGGNVGIFSIQNSFVLFLGVIFIESLYRSLFLCCVLNFDLDKGKENDDEEDVRELDTYVTQDFHLHGSELQSRPVGAAREDGLE